MLSDLDVLRIVHLISYVVVVQFLVDWAAQREFVLEIILHFYGIALDVAPAGRVAWFIYITFIVRVVNCREICPDHFRALIRLHLLKRAFSFDRGLV